LCNIAFNNGASDGSIRAMKADPSPPRAAKIPARVPPRVVDQRGRENELARREAPRFGDGAPTSKKHGRPRGSDAFTADARTWIRAAASSSSAAAARRRRRRRGAPARARAAVDSVGSTHT
jgi:hypothetical protein